MVVGLLTTTPAVADDAQRTVVTFAPQTHPAARDAALADAAVPTRSTYAASVRSPDTARIVAADLTATQRGDLRDDPRVVAVEPDVVVHADAVVPADPVWQHQDGLRAINVDDAWERTIGEPSVVIAVVDTGVRADARELSGKLVNGYDFVNGDADPDDDNGHGTAVATITAATTSNAYGIAGVCWRCRVMPLKALGADGSGFLSDAAQATLWAVEHGADVVNLSLGASDGSSQAMGAALDAADDAGVIVIASAGNAGTTAKQWPAADPRAFGVAALDGDQRANYSNHGSWIDAAAPGCNPTVDRSEQATQFCGTSSAAPLVAGVAALALSTRIGATDDDVWRALTDTARPLASDLGAGIIDADATTRAVAAATPEPGDDPSDEGPRTELPPTEDPTDPVEPDPTPRDPSAPPEFDDTSGSAHEDSIRRLAESGITGGCAPQRYCPARAVTRGQIATFLDRALDLPDGESTFADVPADHPHAIGIGAVARAGITTGCGPRVFCPGAKLTRGQMASLLTRALDLPDGDSAFADVPADHPHATGIGAVARAGITTGCTTDSYCPEGPVTRAQMASFLVRALDL